MNYPPNTQDWQIGDWVIHDADAKGWKYLMLVIDKRKGMYFTIYPFTINPVSVKGTPKKKELFTIYHYEDKAPLHNPRIFDIEIPPFKRRGK